MACNTYYILLDVTSST